MTMNLTIVTPPASEPVSLANAKLQTRVETTADDALIAIYISAAREKVEEIARRAFITQTLRLSLDAWPCERYIKLPRPPLASVTSVKYYDDEGNEYTLPATDYTVDTASEPGRIALHDDATWPVTGDLRPAGGIQITYTAGYGASASAVPAKYQAAILLLTAHLYEHREATTQDALAEIPFGVLALAATDKGWP